jgi:hypothetical protein
MLKRMPRGARAVLAGAVTVVALAAGGVAAFAQGGTPPTLTLAFGADGKLTFSGAEGIVGKAATVAVSSADPKKKAEHAAALVRLEPGVTPEQFAAAAAKAKSFEDIDGVGVIDSFVGAPPKGAPPQTSVTKIVAGATYVVLDFSGEQPIPVGTFVAGKVSPSVKLPTVDFSTSVKEYKFTAKTLPRKGTIRITNRGKQYHEMIGFHVRKGVDPKSIVGRLQQGKEPKKGTTDGEAFLLAPVGPGAVNQAEFTIERGTYVFTCFLADSKGRPHSTQGMNKVITVK